MCGSSRATCAIIERLQCGTLIQAAQQKAALEQQAMQLTMEYQQKKAEEEMQKQQYFSFGSGCE